MDSQWYQKMLRKCCQVFKSPMSPDASMIHMMTRQHMQQRWMRVFFKPGSLGVRTGFTCVGLLFCEPKRILFEKPWHDDKAASAKLSAFADYPGTRQPGAASAHAKHHSVNRKKQVDTFQQTPKYKSRGPHFNKHILLPVIHIAWSMEKYKHAQVSQERHIFDSGCCLDLFSVVVAHHSTRSASVSILYVGKKANQSMYLHWTEHCPNFKANRIKGRWCTGMVSLTRAPHMTNYTHIRTKTETNAVQYASTYVPA